MSLVASFFGGLLGSAHCIGMCGGFAIAIGSTCQTSRSGFPAQLIYSLGRIFTYSFLGVFGGYLGGELIRANLSFLPVQRALSLVAGSIMMLYGASLLGLAPFRSLALPGFRLVSSMMSHFLHRRGRGATFLAGVFTGFLPCGLAYAFLALAMNTGTAWAGLLTMASFGLGTVPAMVLLGCGSSVMGRNLQIRTLRFAALLIVLLGAITIYRAIPFGEAPCPACDTVVQQGP